LKFFIQARLLPVKVLVWALCGAPAAACLSGDCAACRKVLPPAPVPS